MRENGFDGNRRSANKMSSWNGARSGTDLLRGGRLARVGKSVVSFAPMAGGTRVMVSVSAMAIAAMGVLSSDAWAQANVNCEDITATQWRCELTPHGSEINATQVMNISNTNELQFLDVTIFDNVSFKTNTGKAILMGSSGGIRLTQSATGMSIAAEGDTAVYAGNSLSIITGASGPSRSQSAGTGVELLLTGSVTGGVSASGSLAAKGGEDGWRGIHAFSDFLNGGSVTVTAASVKGADDGIDVSNRGTGVASVNASGDVRGHRRHGINVYSRIGSASVSAMKVTGSTTGIKVDASATISVNAGGLVTATGSSTSVGIDALLSKGTTLTITAAAVTGSATGIKAVSSGTGEVSINATGEVKGTGTGGTGIYGIVSNTSGGALTITATSTVTGSAAGIRAVGSGTGAVSVSATGGVIATATGGIGVDAAAGANAGTLTVNVAAVTGSAVGVKAVGGNGNDVDISASGLVQATGASAGVGIDALASSDGALSITAAAVEGSAIGIKAVSSGTGAISVAATGAVKGTGTAGVQVVGGTATSGIVVDVATVTGASGVDARHSGSQNLTISAANAVTGESGKGIYGSVGSSGAALTITANTVSGSTFGIQAVSQGSGEVKIMASGTVTATTGQGIYGSAGASAGALTITAAQAVRGSTAGIKAIGGSDNDVLVMASGAVSAGAGAGVGIDGLVSSGGDLTITATQTVSGEGIGIKAESRGAGAVRVSAASAVTGTATAGIHARGGANTGTMTINVASVAGGMGIDAQHSGSGAVSVNATGTVTGASTSGIYALASGGALTVTAAAVTGIAAGIKAVGSGAGAVSVNATGAVNATVTTGQGVYARASAAGSLSVDVAAVTGGVVGIKALGSGAGDVTVSAGAVTATGTNGIGIEASASGGDVIISAAAVTGTATGIKVTAAGTGEVSISASGAVTGTGEDGIFVDHDGSGATTITVTTAVTGGTGAAVAAIRTDAQSNSTVTIDLNSGASVGTTTGTPNAIMGGAGNTTVTVNTGATVAGKVSLGAGTDELTFAGGAFSNVTEMDGGAGSNTLTFSGSDTSGSLHATVLSEGLKGWESIIVQSGAALNGNVKLADSSNNLTFNGVTVDSTASLDGGAGTANTLGLDNVSGSLIGANVTNWETVRIGSGSTISFGTGTHGLTAGSLEVAGTLNVGDDGGTNDDLTVTGSFVGGGAVTLNASFVTGGGSDKLEIIGSVTGTTSVNVIGVDTNLTFGTSVERIEEVIKVSTTPQNDSVFSFAGLFSGVAYVLRSDDSGDTFDLVRTTTNNCVETSSGSGVFICKGSDHVLTSQELNASGATALDVTLNSETPVNVTNAGHGFNLTQSGTAGITFTQSATGEAVTGAESGIMARVAGGGAISIRVNGTVTGQSGAGIDASASGGNVTVSAASVMGSTAGIKAIGTGNGSISVNATGTVTGQSGAGIDASAGGGNVTVSAASVMGSTAGIKAIGTGNGSISVSATGTVTGQSGAGIDASASGGSVTVSAAGVTGSTSGIKAIGAGNGFISVNATGTVTGQSGVGIDASASGGSVTVSAAGAMGSTTGIRARNTGTGAISVNATGTVTGQSGVGIDVSARDGNVTVSAANVMGATAGINAIGTGGSSVSVSATGTVAGGSGVGINASASGGSVTVSAASVMGATAGISAIGTGGSSVSVSATGTVTSGSGVGINASASGGSVAVSAASVMGATAGISAIGAGGSSVNATGTVTGGSGVGINASASGGNVTVSAASVMGSTTGISAIGTGGGSISVNATGTVTGRSGVGIDASSSGGNVTITAADVTGSTSGIRVAASGAAVVSILATGAVTGTGDHGIYVDHDGSGATTIAVSSAVTGGSATTAAAIKTDVSAGSDVTILLNSGASVGEGAGNAIIGGAGDSNVTVDSNAAIVGKVSLGAGADTLTFSGGDFSSATLLDGGDGSDTLRFSGGSGSLNPAIVGAGGDGLKGWENVVVQRGATLGGNIKLAADSGNLTFDGATIGNVTSLDGGGGGANTLTFNNVSGSLATSALSGWETAVIGAGSRMTLGGSALTSAQARRLSVTGTLAFGSTNSSTDTFTVHGNFAGGGTVAIDVNFVGANGSPTSDRLIVRGDATGTTTISLKDLTPADGRVASGDVEVVTVSGSAAASAFRLADNTVFNGAHFYSLEHVPDDSGDGATFVLRPAERFGAFDALLGTAPSALIAGFAGVPSMSARQASRRSASAGQAVGQLVADDINASGGSKGGKWSVPAERLSPDDDGIRLMSWASAIDVGNRGWIIARTVKEEIEEGPGGSASEVSVAGFDAGFDAIDSEGESGDWTFGLIGRYGTMDLETTLAERTAKMDSSGYGFGGNATWSGDNDVYFDAVAMFSSASSNFTSVEGAELAADVDSTAAVASVEAGKRFDAADMFETDRDVAIIPHARLSRSSVSMDETDIAEVGRVDFGSVSNLIVRVGTTAEFALDGGGALRLSGNVSRDLASAYEIDVDGKKFAGPEPATWVEIGFGGSMGVGENTRLHFDGSYRSGGGSAVGLSGGLSWSW